MNKPLKTASLAQALEAYASGTFVYNNPCCICGKQCSTPTMEIWLRRIREFHGIEQMYREYKCRNCRKVEPLNIKAAEPMHNVVAEPLMHAPVAMPQMMASKKPEQPKPLQQEPPQPMKRTPRPGDPIKHPPGCVGISVWETNTNGDLEYRGTQWTKLFKD